MFLKKRETTRTTRTEKLFTYKTHFRSQRWGYKPVSSGRRPGGSRKGIWARLARTVARCVARLRTEKVVAKRRSQPKKDAPRPPEPRSETVILADLKALCGQPGFANAVAFACIRDDLILYETEVTAENMSSMYAPSRLVRTEVATLLG